VSGSNRFLAQIGGLNFFNSDGFLSRFTRVGQKVYTSVDMGLVSLPITWFGSLVRFSIFNQHFLSIVRILGAIVLFLIITRVL